MKTIYNKALREINHMRVDDENPGCCDIWITSAGLSRPKVPGKCWDHGRYEDKPLCFIPFKTGKTAQADIIRLMDNAYGNTETYIGDWAIEFQVFTRMLLDGYLIINPIFVNMDEVIDEILAIARRNESVSVDTPLGTISAEVLPDQEFPGISLEYAGEDGRPGAIMDFSPESETVRLSVYSAEDPDGDPEKIYDMYTAGCRRKLTQESIKELVDQGKITDTAYISRHTDPSGLYVDLNYGIDPDTGKPADFVTLFAARYEDYDGKTLYPSAWEDAAYVADCASELYGIRKTTARIATRKG